MTGNRNSSETRVGAWSCYAWAMRIWVMIAAIFAVLPVAHAQGIITTRAGTDWVFQGDGRAAVNAPRGSDQSVRHSHDREVACFIQTCHLSLQYIRQVC